MSLQLVLSNVSYRFAAECKLHDQSLNAFAIILKLEGKIQSFVTVNHLKLIQSPNCNIPTKLEKIATDDEKISNKTEFPRDSSRYLLSCHPRRILFGFSPEQGDVRNCTELGTNLTQP